MGIRIEAWLEIGVARDLNSFFISFEGFIQRIFLRHLPSDHNDNNYNDVLCSFLICLPCAHRLFTEYNGESGYYNCGAYSSCGGYNSCGSFNSTWCYYTYAYIRSSSEYRGCCREFRCANSSTWNNSSRNSHTGNNKGEWFEYKMWQWCFDNLVFYGDDYHVLR